MALARHVSYVHRNLTNPEGSEKVYDAAFLKQYISAARQCDPYVPPELSSFIVNEYVTLRSEKDETGSGGHGRSKSNRGRGLAAAGAASSISDQTVMTARQLLSILRLSQALARLRFDDAVNVADVEEAIRLTRMSKASLLDDNEDQERDTRDDMSKIYTLILDYMQSHRLPRMEYIRAEAMVVQKGWRTEQLREMLDFYVEADVFRVSADRTMIELFNTD
ncbi:dna replication licensing factor [Nannochloropsis oceanica]